MYTEVMKLNTATSECGKDKNIFNIKLSMEEDQMKQIKRHKSKTY